jgi:GAF domain-containing protein
VSTRLAVVRAVAAALGTARTELEVGVALLTAVAGHLGAVTASIWLVEGDDLVVVQSRNASPETMAQFGRLSLADELPGGWVVRTGEALFVSNRLELDSRWPKLIGMPSRSIALVVLPLANTGAVTGVISFGFDEARQFDEQDRVGFLAIADQCAIALDRAQLYEAARRGRGHRAPRPAGRGGRAQPGPTARSPGGKASPEGRSTRPRSATWPAGPPGGTARAGRRCPGSRRR